MAEKVVLYSYFRSSASWRVRIALAMKDVKYEYKAVHLIKDGGEQNSEEYKKLNPMGLVPSLEIDGHLLTQSLPIIEYLEEKYAQPALLPNDAYGKAQVRALSEVVNSALERMLKKTAGTYCYGDTVTMADLCLVPQIYNANRFKVDMTQFPIINRIHEKLVELPAFVAADPARQPDTPEDMRKN
ncbi:maleylacetoacetate isomerase [Elysia marginata]|uniref:maleylacetoacetate isomerase n=1 Tax=Elysia marginata TaxID=1093978 RepID=A0AAV4FVD8_9GAST|nr:maleylacetoacetate isomerase [Elysia marginata]